METLDRQTFSGSEAGKVRDLLPTPSSDTPAIPSSSPDTQPDPELQAQKDRAWALREPPAVQTALGLIRGDPGIWDSVVRVVSRRGELLAGTMLPGERHRNFAPLLAGITADERASKILGKAIDRTVQAETQVIKAELEAGKGEVYIPEVVIGTGPHGAIYNSTRMQAGEDAVTFEQDDRVGGVFARAGGPAFKLNSRTRPQRTGTRPIPGTPGNLNALGTKATVQLPDVTGRAYTDQHKLAEVTRVDHLLSSRIAAGMRLIDAEVIDEDELANGTLRLTFLDTQDAENPNKTYTVTTDRVIMASSINEPRTGFEDAGKSTQRILKQESESFRTTGKAKILTSEQADEFFGNPDNPAPLRGLNRVVILGPGDGGRIRVEDLLGYSGIDRGPMQLDRVEELVWMSQGAETKEQFEQRERSRYRISGLEFPREGQPDYVKRITPVKEKATKLKRNEATGDIIVVASDGREFEADLVILETGYRDTTPEIFAKLANQPEKITDPNEVSLRLGEALRSQGAVIRFKPEFQTSFGGRADILTTTDDSANGQVRFQLARDSIDSDTVESTRFAQDVFFRPDTIASIQLPVSSENPRVQADEELRRVSEQVVIEDPSKIKEFLQLPQDALKTIDPNLLVGVRIVSRFTESNGDIVDYSAEITRIDDDGDLVLEELNIESGESYPEYFNNPADLLEYFIEDSTEVTTIELSSRLARQLGIIEAPQSETSPTIPRTIRAEDTEARAKLAERFNAIRSVEDAQKFIGLRIYNGPQSNPYGTSYQITEVERKDGEIGFKIQPVFGEGTNPRDEFVRRDFVAFDLTRSNAITGIELPPGLIAAEARPEKAETRVLEDPEEIKAFIEKYFTDDLDIDRLIGIKINEKTNCYVFTGDYTKNPKPRIPILETSGDGRTYDQYFPNIGEMREFLLTRDSGKPTRIEVPESFFADEVVAENTPLEAEPETSLEGRDGSILIEGENSKVRDKLALLLRDDITQAEADKLVGLIISDATSTTNRTYEFLRVTVGEQGTPTISVKVTVNGRLNGPPSNYSFSDFREYLNDGTYINTIEVPASLRTELGLGPVAEPENVAEGEARFVTIDGGNTEAREKLGALIVNDITIEQAQKLVGLKTIGTYEGGLKTYEISQAVYDATGRVSLPTIVTTEGNSEVISFSPSELTLYISGNPDVNSIEIPASLSAELSLGPNAKPEIIGRGDDKVRREFIQQLQGITTIEEAQKLVGLKTTFSGIARAREEVTGVRLAGGGTEILLDYKYQQTDGSQSTSSELLSTYIRAISDFESLQSIEVPAGVLESTKESAEVRKPQTIPARFTNVRARLAEEIEAAKSREEAKRFLGLKINFPNGDFEQITGIQQGDTNGLVIYTVLRKSGEVQRPDVLSSGSLAQVTRESTIKNIEVPGAVQAERQPVGQDTEPRPEPETAVITDNKIIQTLGLELLKPGVEIINDNGSRYVIESVDLDTNSFTANRFNKSGDQRRLENQSLYRTGDPTRIRLFNFTDTRTASVSIPAEVADEVLGVPSTVVVDGREVATRTITDKARIEKLPVELLVPGTVITYPAEDLLNSRTIINVSDTSLQYTVVGKSGIITTKRSLPKGQAKDLLQSAISITYPDPTSRPAASAERLVPGIASPERQPEVRNSEPRPQPAEVVLTDFDEIQALSKELLKPGIEVTYNRGVKFRLDSVDVDAGQVTLVNLLGDGGERTVKKKIYKTDAQSGKILLFNFNDVQVQSVQLPAEVAEEVLGERRVAMLDGKEIATRTITDRVEIEKRAKELAVPGTVISFRDGSSVVSRTIIVRDDDSVQFRVRTNDGEEYNDDYGLTYVQDIFERATSVTYPEPASRQTLITVDTQRDFALSPEPLFVGPPDAFPSITRPTQLATSTSERRVAYERPNTRASEPLTYREVITDKAEIMRFAEEIKNSPGTRIELNDPNIEYADVIGTTGVGGSQIVELNVKYREIVQARRVSQRASTFAEGYLATLDIRSVSLERRIPSELIVDENGEAIARKIKGVPVIIVGPASRIPVSDRERSQSSAYTKIPDNAVALFRYGPKTQALAELFNSQPLPPVTSGRVMPERGTLRQPKYLELIPDGEGERAFVPRITERFPTEQIGTTHIGNDEFRLIVGEKLRDYRMPAEISEMSFDATVEDLGDGLSVLSTNGGQVAVDQVGELFGEIIQDPIVRTAIKQHSDMRRGLTKHAKVTIPFVDGRVDVAGISIRQIREPRLAT